MAAKAMPRSERHNVAPGDHPRQRAGIWHAHVVVPALERVH